MPKSAHTKLAKDISDVDVEEAREAAYGKALSSGLIHVDADDIAQDSILKGLEDVASGKVPSEDLVPWSVGVAGKKCSTFRRSEGRIHARQDRHHTERITGATNVDDPEAYLGRAWVRLALTKLPERQRVVLALALDGYSANEIGARLEIKPGTVRSHLTLAHRALASNLALQDSALALD